MWISQYPLDPLPFPAECLFHLRFVLLNDMFVIFMFNFFSHSHVLYYDIIVNKVKANLNFFFVIFFKHELSKLMVYINKRLLDKLQSCKGCFNHKMWMQLKLFGS